MKADTSHRGWGLIDMQVELARNLPVSTLDLLCALARDPEASALAALRAPSENEFLRLWRSLQTLPFWWQAIPAEDWQSAAATHVAGLRGKLTPLEEVLGPAEAASMVRGPYDRAMERVTGKLPHLAPITAQATARSFGERPGPTATALLREPFRRRLLEDRQPLLARAYEHVGDMSRYPHLGCVADMYRTLSPDCGIAALWQHAPGRSTEDAAFRVHNAPIAAALCVLQGYRLNDSELFSLRTAHELAPWWFGEVFHLTFLCAFGLEEECRIRRRLASD
jgi:hypothetical protein